MNVNKICFILIMVSLAVYLVALCYAMTLVVIYNGLTVWYIVLVAIWSVVTFKLCSISYNAILKISDEEGKIK